MTKWQDLDFSSDESGMNHHERQWVFVYGTLRKRAGNWAHQAVLEVVEDCHIWGRIYDHGYPVARLPELSEGEEPEDKALIVGDLMLFDIFHPMYERMCRVETGAGYELWEVEVRMPDELTWITAAAWHYDHEPRGELIESGDWHTYDQQKYAQEPA